MRAHTWAGFPLSRTYTRRRRVACASRSHLAEGKCVFACVLMIVLGHDTHRGILPPCKLILRYYQFTSATLREKNGARLANLRGEGASEIKILCLKRRN